MSESTGIKDLKDFNHEHHFMAFGVAVAAYTLAALAYSGTINVVEMAIFLMALFPYMYAFEMIFDTKYVDEYEHPEEKED